MVSQFLENCREFEPADVFNRHALAWRYVQLAQL
jgi:hypothetical protein